MRQRSHSGTGKERFALLVAGAVALGAVAALAAGCSTAKHHRVLSFFFDGVPDPQAAVVSTGPEVQAAVGRQLVRPGEHGPFAAKLCDGCHDSKATNALVAPIEQLCVRCHELGATQAYVHGPLASGGCLVCHDPHRSANRFLLVSASDGFCLALPRSRRPLGGEDGRRGRDPGDPGDRRACGRRHQLHRLPRRPHVRPQVPAARGEVTPVGSRSRFPLAALAGSRNGRPPSRRGALAGWTDFLPRTLDNGAYLEVDGLFEEEENRYSDRTFRWTDTFFREKLTLFSNGYVYHPRFLLYRAAVTGLLSQERYDTTLAPSEEWRPDDGFEYDFSLHLLPEHPYTLNLFARRYEPLFTERFASRENSIATNQGADFRYRRKPYFVHARYSDDQLTSGELSSDVERLGLDGEYFRQYEDGDHLSVTAAYNPSRFDRSTGLEGTTQEALLGNLLAFGRYRLSSNLSSTQLEQDDRRSSHFESDQFLWLERFDVDLPMNFRGELFYRHQQRDNRFPAAAPGRSDSLSNRSRDFSAMLSHDLFESLTSSYTLSRDLQDSQGGDSSSISHLLAFSYDKTIPHGRLLLGTSFGRNDLESSGQTDVVNEPHTGIAVPGSFTLLQQNVEPDSVFLFVRSPVSPFETVQLAEGVHYLLSNLANALEVQVLSLPPLFTLPGTYDFAASYSLADGGFALASRYSSVNGSVQLFDDRLTPYASYSTVTSEVTSGLYPGAVPDSATTTAGLLFRWGDLRGRGEYRSVDWETNPYSMWMGELQYTRHPIALHPSARHRLAPPVGLSRGPLEPARRAARGPHPDYRDGRGRSAAASLPAAAAAVGRRLVLRDPCPLRFARPLPECHVLVEVRPDRSLRRCHDLRLRGGRRRHRGQRPHSPPLLPAAAPRPVLG